MKPFIQTSIAAAVFIFVAVLFIALGLLISTALIMSVHYAEKYRAKSEALQIENNELRDKSTMYEDFWLECQAENAPEMRSGYYDENGKLRFR